MEDLDTFAYMLIAASWTRGIEQYIDTLYSGDIIELHMEEEDQLEAPEHLSTLDLDGYMSRIAPVQLTLGWDPRPCLTETFLNSGIRPHYVQKPQFEDQVPFNICYYRELTLEGFSFPSSDPPPCPADKQRFDEVFTTTLDLARSQDRGLLFIGGWGLGTGYDEDFLADVEPVLRQTRMKFFNRHP
ncbi:MAG: hypothetical protein KY468_01365 [Armatimonadetes bacterium]|nr:hypothetical protein [Armatimonadota bacterium]